MKVLGSAYIEHTRETHEICDSNTGIKTSCGIPLEVIDKQAFRVFLESKRGAINVSCTRCPEQRIRSRLRVVRSHLKKGG